MKKLLMIFGLIASHIANFAQCTTGLISGNGLVTSGLTYSYSYPSATSSEFYWSSTSPYASFPNGVTGQSVNVSFTSPSVQVNLCVTRYGLGIEPSTECKVITVSSCPSIPVIATMYGPPRITGCNNYTFSVTPVSGADHYEWDGFNDGVYRVTSTNSITVNASEFIPNNVQSNELFSARAVSACNYATPWVTLNIPVGIPDTINLISGPSSVVLCSSQQYTYAVNSISGANQYLWTFQNQGFYTTSPQVTVTGAAFNTTSGLFSVVAIGDCTRSAQFSFNSSVTVPTLNPISGPSTVNKKIFGGTCAYPFTVPSIPEASSYVWRGPWGTFTSSTPTYNWAVNSSVSTGNYTIYVKANLTCTGAISTAEVSRNVSVVSAASCGSSGSSAFSSLTISPNPAGNSLAIDTGDAGSDVPLQVVIYSQSGEIVKASTSTESQIVIENLGLPPGIYFVEVLSNDKKEVKRVVIK